MKNPSLQTMLDELRDDPADAIDEVADQDLESISGGMHADVVVGCQSGYVSCSSGYTS
ncbi:hypothetical protein [Chromobacterium sp. CV08]|uniref:hypothetical protein n=1 Tax=Chromobacterium sp. CV08 TaxID=3133274 RepID=UPI003DAA129D